MESLTKQRIFPGKGSKQPALQHCCKLRRKQSDGKSFELIRELTQQKSAVIIGRCSGAIYANDPEATTVFLHADKDCRIKRVMERDGINEKKAAKLIKEVDEKRASFHKFCTGKEWEDANQYQLSIDTGKLDISNAADMIINYINAKNIGQKHL